MDHDDLEKPIGARGRKPAAKGRGRFDGVGVLAVLTFGVLGVVALWAVIVDDPLGGEPVATASIERRTPPRAEAGAPGGQPAPRPEAGHDAARTETSRDGVPVVNAGDPMPKSGPVIIRVPGSEPSAPAARQSADGRRSGAVETAMLEESRFGQLPRIAPDGRRPQDAYARAQPPVSGPRVALVVSGLGVAKEATVQAVKALSPEVTLAFSPYGAEVGALVAEARQDGHEVLIQAPMEPFAYPQNDPGPQTLLTSLPAAANLDRLRWSLGRASGYVGVAPLAGARFLESEDALQPIFAELGRRGVLFVAQGAKGGRIATVARQSGLAYAPVGAAIDAVADAAAIDAALADLERDAKADGVAIGWAGSTPLTLKRIEAWRAGLSARGVTLAPLTAALKHEGPS